MTGKQLPPWSAPVAVVAVILGVGVVAKKHERAVENPLVDLVIITVGVFAFAAVFRVVAFKLNNPGLASFFGAPAQSITPVGN
jgi:hypothetical protein